MNVIKQLITAGLIAFTINHGAMAGDFTDMAIVTAVNPRYETMNVPRQQCQVVQETIPQERSLTGAIVGGVAGAIIGSQVGGGKGKIATGAIGAGAGAIIGDRIDNNNGTSTRQVDRCSLVDNYQQVVRGFDVSYQYQNHFYQTYMSTAVKVGDAIRVQVSVTPF